SLPPSFIPFFHLRLSFFNDTATTEIYTLSLHDALPISLLAVMVPQFLFVSGFFRLIPFHLLLHEHLCTGGDLVNDILPLLLPFEDRKSTRLNSSHVKISYAVFCLKKKKLFIKH